MLGQIIKSNQLLHNQIKGGGGIQSEFLKIHQDASRRAEGVVGKKTGHLGVHARRGYHREVQLSEISHGYRVRRGLGGLFGSARRPRGGGASLCIAVLRVASRVSVVVPLERVRRDPEIITSRTADHDGGALHNSSHPISKYERPRGGSGSTRRYQNAIQIQ